MSILLRVRHRREAEQLAESIAEIARDVLPGTEMRAAATPAGDERRLRGIPAIGRGVAGAIPGSRPGVIR